MTGIKRKNPRRPFQITAAGLRRIVLGDASQIVSHAGPAHHSPAKSKPLRARQDAADWHIAIAHADRGGLDDHARQAIAAAAILATPSTGVLAIILGTYTGNPAELGADAAIVAPEFGDTYDPERETDFAAALIDQYQARHIFLADKPDGDGELGRRLAARIGCEGATHVVELNARDAAVRWSGGVGMARTPLPHLILLAPGAVDPDLPFVGAGEVLAPPVKTEGSDLPTRIRDLGVGALDASGIALEEADFIVSAGNGVSNYATLTGLARVLGASVGASRVAVDNGMCQRQQQIGATGKTVSATTYMAVGISGAVQHLQGIKDCRHVIAINRDAGAPIAARADLTIAGDAEAVMLALLDEIARAKGTHNQQEDSA